MKKIQVVILTLCLAVTGFSQTIYIANSAVGAVGGVNVFTGTNSINLALAAASTGDFIYVVPSSVIYNTVSLGKSVNIIGGGFNPDKPGALRSTVNSVQPGTGANNIRISGLVINTGITFGSGTSVSNIMIDKCRTQSISGGTATLGNVIIENCIIAENYSAAAGINLSSASTNVRISNNIIYSHNSVNGAIISINAGLIENNIFIETASGGTQIAFNNVTNCDIRNNIFLGARPQGAGTFTGNTQQNNLSFGASDNTFSTVNGNTSISNIQGSDPLFVNLPYGATHFFTYNASLQVGSPAIGSGFGGTNMGIFGGTHPFDIYGTSLPLVQAITPPGTVTQGSNMNVRVQAKGN